MPSATPSRIELAERREGLSLPCSVGLRPADRDRVIDEIVRAARPT